MRPTFTVWSMSTHGDNASPNRKSYSFFVVVRSRQMTGTANACTNGRCGTRHHLTHNLCFFSCNKSQLSGLRSYAIRVLCSFVFQVERKDSLSLRIKQPKRDRFFSSLISHLEHWTNKKTKSFSKKWHRHLRRHSRFLSRNLHKLEHENEGNQNAIHIPVATQTSLNLSLFSNRRCKYNFRWYFSFVTCDTNG